MHPYFYNEVSEEPAAPSQQPSPPPPPEHNPQGDLSPARQAAAAHRPQKRPTDGPPERTAAIILISLSIFLCSIAAFMILRWQPPETTSDPPQFDTPDFSAPYAQEALERAPTGDGTILTLEARPEGESMRLQDIYQKVIPSIVSVQTILPDGISQGTGVIMSADGYIITNAHVIENGFRVDVSLEDGQTFQALLVGSDASTDLAVLKVDAYSLTPAAFGASEQIAVGDTVAAIGNPMGEELRGSMTDGILSAINRDIEVNGYEMTLLQTTAALNTGNSGGALVNDQGQVIGITNMKMVASDVLSNSLEGLGFAIPISTVKPVVDSLIAAGYVTNRPTLGITVRPLYEDEKLSRGIDHGILVAEVLPNSDAIGKLRADDILLSANGTQLNISQDLLTLKDALKVGDSILFEVDRNGTLLEISVALMEQHDIYSG